MDWFVKTYLGSPIVKLSVLDVGSCDVEGGSYRQLFAPEKFDYAGLDLAEGPNVDIVPAFPYFWPEVSSDSYDVVISGQAFEHMEFFWLAALEMARVLKPGGLMCVIAPRGFGRHRYPVDCYRFDADGMTAIARWCSLIPLHATTDMAPPDAGDKWHIEDCEDSMLVARKPNAWAGPVDPSVYKFMTPDLESLTTGFQPCPAPLPQETFQEDAYKAVIAQMAEELSELRKREAAYKTVIAQMAEELPELRDRVSAYERSNSWRLTAPLRALRKAARKLAGKPE